MTENNPGTEVLRNIIKSAAENDPEINGANEVLRNIIKSMTEQQQGPERKEICCFSRNHLFSDGTYGTVSIPMTCEWADKYNEKLVDPYDIVLKKEKINVLFDYPFSNKKVFTLESSNGEYFTRIDLATLIAKQYQKMYKEEEETSKIEEATFGEVYGEDAMLTHNRIETDGKWGIWGHVLSDLGLSVIFDNGDYFTLGVCS